MSEVVNHYVPASASPDLPLAQEWVDRNPTVQANLTETIEASANGLASSPRTPTPDSTSPRPQRQQPQVSPRRL